MCGNSLETNHGPDAQLAALLELPDAQLEARLNLPDHLYDILVALRDESVNTVSEMAFRFGLRRAGAAARIRDLRKAKYGSYKISYDSATQTYAYHG